MAHRYGLIAGGAGRTVTPQSPSAVYSCLGGRR